MFSRIIILFVHSPPSNSMFIVANSTDPDERPRLVPVCICSISLFIRIWFSRASTID